MGVLPVVNKFAIWQEVGISPLAMLIIVELLYFFVGSRPKVRVNIVPLSNILLLPKLILNQRLGLLLLD